MEVRGEPGRAKENLSLPYNGDGTFTEGAAAAGLADATLGKDSESTASFADYDNDGFMDVFFSGDVTSDVLYRNQRRHLRRCYCYSRD